MWSYNSFWKHSLYNEVKGEFYKSTQFCQLRRVKNHATPFWCCSWEVVFFTFSGTSITNVKGRFEQEFWQTANSAEEQQWDSRSRVPQVMPSWSTSIYCTHLLLPLVIWKFVKEASPMENECTKARKILTCGLEIRSITSGTAQILWKFASRRF